jgi:hypothetical protein
MHRAVSIEIGAGEDEQNINEVATPAALGGLKPEDITRKEWVQKVKERQDEILHAKAGMLAQAIGEHNTDLVWHVVMNALEKSAIQVAGVDRSQARAYEGRAGVRVQRKADPGRKAGPVGSVEQGKATPIIKLVRRVRWLADLSRLVGEGNPINNQQIRDIWDKVVAQKDTGEFLQEDFIYRFQEGNITGTHAYVFLAAYHSRLTRVHQLEAASEAAEARKGLARRLDKDQAHKFKKMRTPMSAPIAILTDQGGEVHANPVKVDTIFADRWDKFYNKPKDDEQIINCFINKYKDG